METSFALRAITSCKSLSSIGQVLPVHGEAVELMASFPLSFFARPLSSLGPSSLHLSLGLPKGSPSSWGLTQQKRAFSPFRSLGVQIQCWLVPSEASLLGWQTPPSPVASHGCPPVCLISSLFKIIIYFGLASWHVLEKGMATHSSILAWRTPWTGEPGGLQSVGLQRVRHD